MKPEDIEEITKLKQYAVKKGKYQLATMLRDIEKSLIKELNMEYTENLLNGIIKQVKKEIQDEI